MSHAVALMGRAFFGVAVSVRVKSKAPDAVPPATEYWDASQSSAASCLHGSLQFFVREFARSESLQGKTDVIAAAVTLIMTASRK